MPYELNVEHKSLINKRPNKHTNPVKAQFEQRDTQNRYYQRRKLHFKTGSMKQMGQVSAKPSVNYWAETEPRKTAPYLFGLEIELEHLSSRSNPELADLLDRYLPNTHYVCTDGSLHNYGYEIVTAPRTIAEIKQSYHLYYGLLTGLTRSGFTAHDNNRCGLHVHVSRKAMSTEKWTKLAKFVSRNKSIFEKLSRRTAFNYCEMRYSSNSRYSAVNLISSNTVEFRFFRGTLNPKSFFASLEIIQSLVDFFRIDAKSYGTKGYIKYLKNSGLKYGYSYLLDQCPTMETGYKRYTVEERAARKLERQRRTEQRISQLRTELNSLVGDAQYSLRGRTPYGLNNLDLTLDTHSIAVAPVPIYLCDDFSNPLRQIAASELPTVRIAFLPTALTPEQRQNLHVFVNRTRGWGNCRSSFQIRTSRPIP